MSQHPAALADALLERHVQYELSRLSGKRFLNDARKEVDDLYARLPDVTLNDVVSADSIMGVIQRKVIDLDIEGGIPELAGELARQLYGSENHRGATLQAVINDQQVDAFIDEILLLRAHRERVVNGVLSHPVYAELVSNILYNGIVNYIYEGNLISKNVPGVSPMMKFGARMFSKAAPGLDSAVEKNLKAYIARNTQFIVKQSEAFLNHSLTDEQLRESANDLWDKVRDRTLGDLQDGMDDIELSEFIVLGYEFWLAFRKTPYFTGACRTVIDAFFERYGDRPLAELVGDVGVNAEMVMAEIEAFAPAIIKQMKRSGHLEALLRRRLEPFYRSDAVKRLLAGETDGQKD